ncbi:MAG: DUF3572 domain-containing protein [Methylocystis sp.]
MRITKGPPQRPAPKRAGGMGRDEAEALGLGALTFLLDEDDRVERFLQLTGVDPSALPGLASRPSFLLAVLDHLAGDEQLLLSFASEQQVKPEKIALARRALGGGDMG